MDFFRNGGYPCAGSHADLLGCRRHDCRVGGILPFLPNIFILFLALASFGGQRDVPCCAVMNGLMGLLGRAAFIPMILGVRLYCACSDGFPRSGKSKGSPSDYADHAVYVLRARLPIYILFSALFFSGLCHASSLFHVPHRHCRAILVAFVLHKMGPTKSTDMLLIEPPNTKCQACALSVFMFGKRSRII